MLNIKYLQVFSSAISSLKRQASLFGYQPKKQLFFLKQCLMVTQCSAVKFKLFDYRGIVKKLRMPLHPELFGAQDILTLKEHA